MWKARKAASPCPTTVPRSAVLPRLNEDVSRPERIRIRYVDEHFVEHDEEYDGFAARVIQHEYDHLDGKLFIDRISRLKRIMFENKLKKGTRQSQVK